MNVSIICDELNGAMHIVITGGAGFIGSNLIRKLFAENPGIQITCVDNFDPFYSADLKQLNIRDYKANPDFHFVYQDISSTSGEEFNELIPGTVDRIIHIAAKAGVRPSIENPMAYLQTNIIGLEHMLEFSKLKNCPPFLFASSSSVYGVNTRYPWKEEEQLLPISPYAMTKLAGEMMGHVYSKLNQARFIALRFFTVYGPSQRPDLAIHKFTKALLQDEQIPVYGDGSSSRDYTYVDDITAGITAAMEYDQSLFEIINLGNNHAVSLLELIRALEKVTGKKAQLEYFTEQPGDVPRTFADISKAGRLLGYQPQISLPEGLQRFYGWFRANEEIILPSS